MYTVNAKRFHPYEHSGHSRSILQALNDAHRSLWEQQTNDIELKDLPSQCYEWFQIDQEIRATIPNAHIIKIQRIQNKWLWEEYEFCKQRMMRKNGDQAVNEKRLFHGSKYTPPENIYCSEHGFDFRFGNAGMWGKGAYFASDANY